VIGGSEDSFFDLQTVLAAIGRDLRPSRPVVASLDVARFGRDQSAWTVRAGPKVFAPITWSGKSTDETAERAYRLWQTGVEGGELHPSVITVDSVGVGGGAFDLLKRLIVERQVSRLVSVVEYRAGERAPSPHDQVFANAKTFCAQRLATALEAGAVSLPDSPRLIEELLSYRLAPDPSGSGRAKITDPKGKSPDLADSLLGTFWGEAKSGPAFVSGIVYGGAFHSVRP